MNTITVFRGVVAVCFALQFISCVDAPAKKIKQSKTGEIFKKQRPNIIVILCDDLGYADVGFNGAKDIKTPALDQLAHAGTIITSGYVPHPFCGPSRAGIMTGRYPHTIGAQYNLPPNTTGLQNIPVVDSIEQGISLKETFISKMLQESGYYTGAIGKWHLGATPKYHPNQRGFDEFYGFLGGGHSYFPDHFRPIYEGRKKVKKVYDYDYLLPLEHNGKQVDEKEYITDGLSREAVNFVEKASKKEEPFFLYLAYNAPHTPLEAKEEDIQKYNHIEDKNRRIYAAMVHAVDRGVGELVLGLKATGEFDNTLIIFLSDNGGRTDKGASNFPLKGRKGNTLEGGFRVPMFFHWPNHVTAGKTYDYPVSALDFYPTFAKLAGVEIPETKVIHGKDIWKSFIAGNNPRKGETIFALRHRERSNEVGMRQDHWKAYKGENTPWELFNIVNDIGEKKDLSKKYPEKLNEMVKLTHQWSQKHAEPKWFHDKETGVKWINSNMPDFDKTFKIH
ncbi:sulfatase-like hydrolase/transferase [Aquimarina algiphila]|uniref:sulfatase-like hydrolase/transferase n=1 Tax=Aquimarina algiphila TaxID=2047982 RepID=UPI00232B33C1|nr:sulfatase-like hydrolase/transferase [Aquimarina algiphila]